jgi:flagellar transcriptional activator FlhD
MKLDEMLAEMRDVNLNYLMLAQSMIKQDKATAVFRLGISQDVAGLIEALTPAQILKLAASGMMVSRFRFDDGMVLNMLASHTKDRAIAQSHAAILMAGQPVEAFA